MSTTPLSSDFPTLSMDAETVSSVAVHFQVVDYVMLVIMLLLSLAVGVYFAFFSGKQTTTNEYFKGDSKMPIIPIVFSIMASFLSSNGMLGVPAEVYLHGFNFWYMNLGSLIAIPIVVYWLLPVFYDMQLTSVFEYLEKRFGRNVRFWGAVISIISMMIWASFVTYGPALALSQVTGLSLWGSIITTTVMASIYTSLGGIKAVVWADTVQLVVFATALLVVLIKGCIYVGGIDQIITKSFETNRLEPLSFSFDPRERFTFWGGLIGGILGWTSGYGLNQIQIQRYLACSTRQRAQKSLWLNYPGMMIFHTVYCCLGLLIFAAYWNCDPTSSKQIQQADQIFPLFVMHATQSLPGIPGLFVAGVYSASLSTTSSQLNSLAAITLEDFIKPFKKDLTDAQATKLSKIIALAFGVFCLVAVTGITKLGSIVQAIIYLCGGSNGAALGIFTLGLMIPWSNSEGTIIGTISGLALGWWVSLGNQINRPKVHYHSISTDGCNATLGNWTAYVPTERADDTLEIYKISYIWILPLAWGVTVLVGAVASCFVGKHPPVDPSLISPPLRRFLKNSKYMKTDNDYKENAVSLTLHDNDIIKTEPTKEALEEAVSLMYSKSKLNGTQEK